MWIPIFFQVSFLFALRDFSLRLAISKGPSPTLLKLNLSVLLMLEILIFLTWETDKIIKIISTGSNRIKQYRKFWSHGSNIHNCFWGQLEHYSISGFCVSQWLGQKAWELQHFAFILESKIYTSLEPILPQHISKSCRAPESLGPIQHLCWQACIRYLLPQNSKP